MKTTARPHRQAHGCCLPLDALCSAVEKKGDKQDSGNHPKLDDMEKQGRKTGGHNGTVKDRGKKQQTANAWGVKNGEKYARETLQDMFLKIWERKKCTPDLHVLIHY